jgi:hypothetical protein
MMLHCAVEGLGVVEFDRRRRVKKGDDHARTVIISNSTLSFSFLQRQLLPFQVISSQHSFLYHRALS